MALKADLHLHTREGDAFITWDAHALIDRAADAGYDVLSVTNHDRLTYSAELVEHAAARDVLLIPGAEATIEGCHVLLYNFDVPLSVLRTFDALRRYKGSDWLVVAPHPFFPASFSLGSRLLRELDLFDAIELSHFYTRRLDFNRRAVAVARETGLPLIGSSDSHLAHQLGTTYSLVDGAPTVFSVLSAIRARRVDVVSRPLSWPTFVRTGLELTLRGGWARIREEIWEGAPAEVPRGVLRSR